MARPPLPRYRADLNLVLELAAHDLDDADARAVELANVAQRAAAKAVRAYGSRTARVLEDTRTLSPASEV